ncbi:Crp/Fnr family transcriptional regulator [Tenacibaculum amylolyticum]|uniref:Crp/Fnr family transcriptional regulator n=1 Tax=Tenacibaculum amylolyticum TaxID=104269 RepID=UPI003892FEF5
MKNYTKYWFLEGFNLFKKLGALTMMRICEILEMDTIDKGEKIELENSNEKKIFFLKKGTIKIVNTETNTVKYIVKRGNIFGELALYEQGKNLEAAYALEDSIVCYIEANQMEELMQKHKSLKNGILKIYGLRIKKLERRLNDLLYKDSTTRIKEFVFDYISELGEEIEGDILQAKNLLSHAEIANLTNTSRQTVNNVMSNLRKQGIINYDTQYISTNKKALVENMV